MSVPNSFIWPELGRMSPLIWLNSVVLPAPFGPIISRRSPGRIASDTSCVTTRPPNAFFRPTISSARLEEGAFIAIPSAMRAINRVTPGTMPAGITSTMNRKTSPSSMFQRST